MAYREKDTKKWSAQWFEEDIMGGKVKRKKRGFDTKCCFSHYLQLHVAHYLPPFSKLSQRFQHIIQSQLCILNTVIKKRSTLFNPNEFADCKNIRVFCNV